MQQMMKEKRKQKRSFCAVVDYWPHGRGRQSTKKQLTKCNYITKRLLTGKTCTKELGWTNLVTYLPPLFSKCAPYFVKYLWTISKFCSEARLRFCVEQRVTPSREFRRSFHKKRELLEKNNKRTYFLPCHYEVSSEFNWMEISDCKWWKYYL